ncbi:MAG TPA: ABC transporter permease, partial [Thermomicrobiales bacterium]|nr:ABC transporter permease [Thermomicrobiales bacterium]
RGAPPAAAPPRGTPMGRYIARRLVQLVPVVFGITLVLFVLLRLLPGDPASAMLGDHATDEAVRRIDQQYGLGRPIYIQYFFYLRTLATFNLGMSIKYGVPVSSLLFHRLQVSLSVVAMTLVLTLLIAIPLGILAALKKDSWLDNLVRSTFMVLMLMPSFWVGILLIIFFSVRLGLFPVSGFGASPLDHLHHLFLPGLTIALGLSPILIRTLRSSILEALDADYVKTARAKGLRERVVITTHVLRNALIPSLTLLGLSIGGLMGGTVILEKVFALPGAGALLIDSINARDYPVVQAATMIFAAMVILVNLATDILYSVLDPRVRYS